METRRSLGAHSSHSQLNGGNASAAQKSSALKKGLQRCLPYLAKYQGTVCRAVAMRYANTSDLLTGEGAKLAGGRWNPVGHAAVYTSLDPFAALAETLGTYGKYGIHFAKRMPLVLIGIEVVLGLVLDLRDSRLRRRIGVTVADLLNDDWQSMDPAAQKAFTQAIGRLAGELQVEALLVPSARLKNRSNLVIFPEQLTSSSTVKIVNQQVLPASR
jgi:RES domain-containing protein